MTISVTICLYLIAEALFSLVISNRLTNGIVGEKWDTTALINVLSTAEMGNTLPASPYETLALNALYSTEFLEILTGLIISNPSAVTFRRECDSSSLGVDL